MDSGVEQLTERIKLEEEVAEGNRKETRQIQT